MYVDFGSIVILLLIGVITGTICAAIATNKERNTVAWFFVGLVVGFFGHVCLFWIPILIVAVLPNLKEQRERDQYIERENRRLREQIRQERMKNESFRQHAAARLDVHDQTLGLDTRDATSDRQLGTESMRQLTGGQDAPGGDNWYYERNGEAVGPLAAWDLRQKLKRGEIRLDTLIWAEHLGDWTAAEFVPEIAADRRG